MVVGMRWMMEMVVMAAGMRWMMVVMAAGMMKLEHD